MDMQKHKVDNEYRYEGIPLSGDVFPPEQIDKLKTFRFYEDDVFIATYPKAGTTWMQELAFLVVTEGDFEAASQSNVMQRGPFLEACTKEYDAVQLAEEMDRPRQLKTHLQYKIFKDAIAKHNPKVIVVMRNLKDNIVSYYHMYKAMINYNFPKTCTMDDFLQLFDEKRLVFGDWFDFNLSWWEEKDNPNFLFVKYEELKKDVRAVIRRVATFLNKSLDPSLIEAIAEHTSFEKMTQNDKTNYTFAPFLDLTVSPFMRKGIVGDWKSHFTPTQVEQLDKLIETKLAGTGLSFEC